MQSIKQQLIAGDLITDEQIMTLFRFQASHNPTYRQYLQSLNRPLAQSPAELPFLPIQFFKSHNISTQPEAQPQKIFYSSGTTGQTRSQHRVYDLDFYHQHSRQLFERAMGSLASMTIYALLPSYQENPSSSLIEMVNHLMASAKPASRYIRLEELPHLSFEEPTILFGVTFALLKASEQKLFDEKQSQLKIIETGGMKGMAKEMPRQELHDQLKSGLGVSKIYSEYGMTELLSQAYTDGNNGLFSIPHSMRVAIKDINDPFRPLPPGQVGKINLIDLANVDTCAFIETEDLGRMVGSSHFEVLGRLDHSEIRGCNLLMAQ